MQKPRFFLVKGVMMLGIIIIFSKIYQQNQVIKLQYEKQRLERQYQELLKTRNSTRVALSQAKNYSALKIQAEQEFHMVKLPLSNLITFTGCFL